jgi:glycosyltransferase involved in cell wall biosynthesis
VAAPVVCELTGEDLFLGQLIEPYRSAARSTIRARVRDVNAFVATSAYYADEMGRYLDVDRARIAVVHPAVPGEYVAADTSPRPHDRPPTVGYVARICPEKGFGQLVEAMELLRRMPGMADARLLAGGYLSPADRDWYTGVMRRAEAAGQAGAITYFGELDRREKLKLLDTVDVLSVPSLYAEAKGIYVLEALARGVPVVQPAHGSFPELLELTGGGLLTPPGDLPALASALAELLRDSDRRAALGRAGRDAVRDGFTDDHMAGKMLDVYRDVLRQESTTAA